MKLEFKPSDFEDCGPANHPGGVAEEKIASSANAALERMLSEATVVYSYRPNNEAHHGWSPVEDEDDADTHRALLVNIEEIKPKECAHEPGEATFIPKTTSGGMRLENIICRCCGIKLQARWEPAE